MPKIEIETCSKTPNSCALEAVQKAMLDNYTKRKIRDYQHESIVKVESGRVLKVVEEPCDQGAKSPCSCRYKVTKLDAGE